MLRSTFISLRCLDKQATQRTSLWLWCRANIQSGRSVPPLSSTIAHNTNTWQLIRGQKDVRFPTGGHTLRIKGLKGLRSKCRPSALKTLDLAPVTCYQLPSHLLAAPVFLAPLIAFFKSTVVFKAGAAIVAIVKTSFVAKAFASLVAYFKSGTVFKVITAISRVSLSIIASLRLQGRRLLRWWHGDEHYERTKRQYEAEGRTGFYPHFRKTTRFFLLLPTAFLAIAVLSSIERTPIWGRLRFIMMNTDEEALLVEEFLKPGSPPGSHLDTTVSRDWLAILRASCGEEAGPPGTLMGMPVLDPREDWRARWVRDVFARLAEGMKYVNLTAEHAKEGHNVVEIGSTRFAVPPVEYPLTVRPATLKHHGRSTDEHVEGPLITRYGCLVVESPFCNAFSLGFGPALQTDQNKPEEAPGVVVVFTGLLDEILKGNEGSVEPGKQEKPSSTPASNALFGVFQQAVASPPQSPSMPVMPTKQQTDQLASTLAHELSHLLLSHSLETWASNNMYESIAAFCTDLIRTVLYPLTAVFGPVFNDWFGEQIRINSALGLRITSSCASRAAEIEADLLGVRILLGAGIDPRIALEDWKAGGLFDRVEQRENGQGEGHGSSPKPDDDNWLERTGFGRSHPMNGERHRRIKEELEKWEQLGKAASAGGREGKMVIGDAQRPSLSVSNAAP